MSKSENNKLKYTDRDLDEIISSKIKEINKNNVKKYERASTSRKQ